MRTIVAPVSIARDTLCRHCPPGIRPASSECPAHASLRSRDIHGSPNGARIAHPHREKTASSPRPSDANPIARHAHSSLPRAESPGRHPAADIDPELMTGIHHGQRLHARHQKTSSEYSREFRTCRLMEVEIDQSRRGWVRADEKRRRGKWRGVHFGVKDLRQARIRIIEDKMLEMPASGHMTDTFRHRQDSCLVFAERVVYNTALRKEAS